MISTTTDPKAWSPYWDAGTKFLMRAGNVLERGDFEAELAQYGAGRVLPFQVEQAFLEGVDALLADSPDDAARVREVQAAFEALEPGQKLPDEERMLLEGAREAVRQHWPPFRAMMAQEVKRQELLPTIAFRRFCSGWEGSNMGDSPLPPFKAGIDKLVDLDTMKRIDPLLIRIVGTQAYNLLWATGDEKNFELPSPPAASRKRSAGTNRKAGSSGKTNGRKTRSSRSRTESSPS